MRVNSGSLKEYVIKALGKLQDGYMAQAWINVDGEYLEGIQLNEVMKIMRLWVPESTEQQKADIFIVSLFPRN